MKSMRAGQLRQRITIQRLGSRVDDGAGGGSIPYADLATQVPAAVEPLSARELLVAQQFDARITHRVRTRFIDGIRPSDRILCGSRIFDIKAVVDPEERHIELELMCEELVTW